MVISVMDGKRFTDVTVIKPVASKAAAAAGSTTFKSLRVFAVPLA